MSALGDVAAAILPPEAGGPDPERVASVARRMVSRMPRASQAGLGAALIGLEAFSWPAPAAASAPPRRSSAKSCSAGRPARGSPAARRAKSVVMLAHGADTFAARSPRSARATSPRGPTRR